MLKFNSKKMTMLVCAGALSTLLSPTWAQAEEYETGGIAARHAADQKAALAKKAEKRKKEAEAQKQAEANKAAESQTQPEASTSPETPAAPKEAAPQ